MWKIIVITCPNINISLTIEKRIQILQKQGLFSKDLIISCINDPDRAIGSGGATINALLTAVELLSAKRKSVANVEVLKDSYILIFHMGRLYPFDIAGKAFSMLPIRNSTTDLLMTNFEILYDLMTNKIASNSDPGVYICSTDMTLITAPGDESRISIRNSSICVLSCLATKDGIRKHGLYDYYESGEQKYVKNIYFHKDDNILKNAKNENGLFALVNGIVYFNYEVASTLYHISISPPISSCTYHGLDNQEAPVVLSLFFDLLLPCCTDVQKEDFVKGLFSSNHSYNLNQTELISKSRITLWNSLRSFKVNLMFLRETTKYIYYDGEKIDQRKCLFVELSLLNNFDKGFFIDETNFQFKKESNSTIFNSIFIENSQVKVNKNVIILNSQFSNNNSLDIGENCFLNDLTLSNCSIKIPDNTFIQKIDINFEALKTSVPIIIAFGMLDNLSMPFNNENWTILNKTWSEFSRQTLINENDLWDADTEAKSRTLLNAKLYIWLDPFSELQISDSFNQIHASLFTEGIFQVNIWRRCARFSLEDLMQIADVDTTFANRSQIENKIKVKFFIENVCKNRPMNFLASISYHILNGSIYDLLKSLDEAAIENKKDFCILPRIMAFICSILLELSGDLRVLKTGPRSNNAWVNAYSMIESGRIEEALTEMARLRKEWSIRPDLMLRASRHYEGAMQCFIRLAVNTCSRWVSLKRIAEPKSFEWIKVTSPARLDLAGAWSDTPPICYECEGSCVTNVAIQIEGTNPIGAKARIIRNLGDSSKRNHIQIVMKESADENETDVKLYFNDLNDFKDFNKPLVAGCLMKAVFIYTKLVDLNSLESLDKQLEKKIGGSLELHTWTNLPHGSGLGTSSILIGCILSAIWNLMKIDVSNKDIIYAILIVEQMMTTGGGWQDQCGGLLGGFRLTKCKKSLPLEIEIDPLSFPSEFEHLFNERLLLVYTGVTRLAKDLLLTALRNWYAISNEICENLRSLVKNGNMCAEAIRKGNLNILGDCVNKHRQHKLVMAPGSIPKEVNDIIVLLSPICYGMALAGAGGGGFLYILTKEANKRIDVQSIIDSTGYHMKLYDAKLSKTGLTVEYI